MSIFLKKFENHTQYETYTASTEFITPNVSLCVNENEVHYNPWVETRVVAKFNVTDTSSPTRIASGTSNFSAIEIDGVEQPSVVSTYTFSTTGEHTVKYTLADPTSIGNNAFTNCSSLTSIDIPNSVTTIGSGMCSGCTSLTNCTIGSGVTSIGDNIFYQCSAMTSCTIGSSVTRISNSAFYNCYSLTSINIPSGVTSISNNAFLYCASLTSIVCNATTAPTIQSNTFRDIKRGGTLTVPIGSSGYDVWMGTDDYYLGKYGWTKVEQ